MSYILVMVFLSIFINIVIIRLKNKLSRIYTEINILLNSLCIIIMIVMDLLSYKIFILIKSLVSKSILFPQTFLVLCVSVIYLDFIYMIEHSFIHKDSIKNLIVILIIYVKNYRRFISFLVVTICTYIFEIFKPIYPNLSKINSISLNSLRIINSITLGLFIYLIYHLICPTKNFHSKYRNDSNLYRFCHCMNILLLFILFLRMIFSINELDTGLNIVFIVYVLFVSKKISYYIAGKVLYVYKIITFLSIIPELLEIISIRKFNSIINIPIIKGISVYQSLLEWLSLILVVLLTLLLMLFGNKYVNYIIYDSNISKWFMGIILKHSIYYTQSYEYLKHKSKYINQSINLLRHDINDYKSKLKNISQKKNKLRNKIIIKKKYDNNINKYFYISVIIILLLFYFVITI